MLFKFDRTKLSHPIISGFLGVMSMLMLSFHENLHLVLALLFLTAGSAGVAIADVTIDACVAQNSISHPSLAADMQSLCALSSSIGALLGFSLSGVFVHLIGPKVSLCKTNLSRALELLFHYRYPKIFIFHNLEELYSLYLSFVGCIWLVDNPSRACIFSWHYA